MTQEQQKEEQTLNALCQSILELERLISEALNKELTYQNTGLSKETT